MFHTSLSACDELFWTRAQPDGKYQLLCNGQQLGWLQHGEYWSSESNAEFGGHIWRLRRPGTALGETELREGDLPNALATYKSHWGGGGTLTCSDGTRFLLACSGIWHHIWSLRDENGDTVLRIEPRSRKVSLGHTRNISLPGDEPDRLLLLIVFLWHEILQAQDEADIVAIMSATS